MGKNRLYTLIQKLNKYKIDALLVTKPENIFYLTSFFADTIVLVAGIKKSFVVTDFIYAEAATRFFRKRGLEVFVSKDKRDYLKIIAEGVNKYRIRKLGFESLYVNLSRYKKMEGALNNERLTATENIIETMREIKEKEEILALKKTINITAETFKNVKKQLRPDSTELSISRYIKEIFIKKGADGCAFEPIVATQPFSSQPHYKVEKKKLGINKAILIDLGARSGGYNSDLTRMCALGKISSKFKSLYTIIVDAQNRAIERIKPGVKISDIDLAARQHIDRKGLGKFFGHALGHGIGLEIHERPFISNKNKDLLKEGMVFTVEPGIYIPNFGGLRIEEMVMVTKGSCKVLTDDIDKSI